MADAIAPGGEVRQADDARGNVRDAIEATKLKTLQGVVSFDKNGDLQSRIVSVFQAKHDAEIPGRGHDAPVQICRGGAAGSLRETGATSPTLPPISGSNTS